ncbi:17770_t:CDS:2 [Cetraspora pellucida]|uniref:17770_t:CDS:1 n=1 Tax=Cetraspora pellucida TaxID=1433469 RepID=A0A9N9EHT4_9GLOM|nr:17770_t:CDS:2 [Cetraspora pellucida]
MAMLTHDETKFPLIFDSTRKVLIPQYVHPEKYLASTTKSTERNPPIIVISDDECATEAPSPVETSHLSAFSDNESLNIRSNKLWTDNELMILLDYVEANYEEWRICKREFCKFIEKAKVLEKNYTSYQIEKKLNTLVATYSKIRKNKEIGIKDVKPRKFPAYDRMHEIFGHRPIEEYIILKGTSEPKKRFSQNIDSMDDNEQVNSSSNLKAKRAKYSHDRNTTDDGITDSEYETLVQPFKSKKSPDLCFKLKRTDDGIPIYSFGPRVQQYWSCDMIHLLMDCIEANVDVFWKNPTMFWDWLATNVFTNRTPFAIAQKFYELRPDKHVKGLRALKKLKKKSDDTKLIEKIERCFQRLYEKKTWSRDRDRNVMFKYPPGYDPEQISSEDTITRPLPAISLKIDESDLNFAKHLLKYSHSDDAYTLSKCSGTNDKIRWPELKENLGREPQKCEPFDWTDQTDQENSDSMTISESADANASIALLPDDPKRKFKPLYKGLTKKYSFLEQEVISITHIMNSLNEQKIRPQSPTSASDQKKRSQPPVSDQNKADDYMSNIQKCCTTFAVEDALRKILDALMGAILNYGNRDRQEMEISDSEQHLSDTSEHHDHINSKDSYFTTEHVNSEDHISNDPTIKWDTILRAARIAGLPHSVIKNTYYRISKLYDKDKQFEDSIKEMKLGEFEGLISLPYLDGQEQLRIWDTEAE